MSDFSNKSILASELMPRIPLSNIANERAKSILLNTADNFLSAEDSYQISGEVSNYVAPARNKVVFKYVYNGEGTGYFTYLQSDYPIGTNSNSYYSYNVIHNTSILQFMIKDNYAYVNDQQIIFYLSNGIINQFSSKYVTTVYEGLHFNKNALPDFVRIEYIGNRKYSISTQRYGQLGLAVINEEFISDVLTFTPRVDTAPVLGEFTEYKIGYHAEFEIPGMAKSFIFLNIKDIQTTETKYLDTITYSTPDARLNQITPIFSYADKIKTNTNTFSSIYNKMITSGISADTFKEWGTLNGFAMNMPIDSNKFINYKNYYWIGHLLPAIVDIYNQSAESRDMADWLDVRNLAGISISYNKELMPVLEYAKLQWQTDKIFVAKKTGNILASSISIDPFDVNVDIDTSMNVISVSDNILVFVKDTDGIMHEAVFKYNSKSNDGKDEFQYSISKGISFDFNIMPLDNVKIDEIYYVFNSLKNNPVIAFKTSFSPNLTIPQYYCIERQDLEAVYPLDSDWSRDNYWISINDLDDHAAKHGYNPNDAIAAEFPIIEFRKFLKMNDRYDEFNTPSDDQLDFFYVQRKTLSNQTPLFNIYNISGNFIKSECILSYQAYDNSFYYPDFGNCIAYRNVSGQNVPLLYIPLLDSDNLCYKNTDLDEVSSLFSDYVQYIPTYYEVTSDNTIKQSVNYNSHDGAWQTPDPIKYNIRHEPVAEFDFASLSNVVQNTSGTSNVLNYNIGYDYLVSLYNNDSVDIVTIIEDAKQSYSQILNYSVDYILHDWIETISNPNFISEIEVNGKLDTDKLYYNFLDTIRIRNFNKCAAVNQVNGLPLTLPMLGFCDKVNPQVVLDNVVNDHSIVCHDGHKIPYFTYNTDGYNAITDLQVKRVDGSVTGGIVSATLPRKMYKNQIWHNISTYQTLPTGYYLFNVISDDCVVSNTIPNTTKYKFWIDVTNNNILFYNQDISNWTQFTIMGRTPNGYYYDRDGVMNDGNPCLVSIKTDSDNNIDVSLFGDFIAPALIEYNVEDLVNNKIVLRLEQQLYDSVPTVKINDYKAKNNKLKFYDDLINLMSDAGISANAYNVFLSKLEGRYAKYCIDNKSPAQFVDFMPDRPFTWNYSLAEYDQSIIELASLKQFSRWHDMYDDIYGSHDFNINPWKLLDMSEPDFRLLMDSKSIVMFTRQMWTYLRDNMVYGVSNSNGKILSIDFNTGDLLPPYINVRFKPQYADNALITKMPTGISQAYGFGENGPAEYVWRIGDSYRYDVLIALFQTLPIPILKTYLGYTVCEKYIDGHITEYHRNVSRIMSPIEYPLYNEANGFTQEINANIININSEQNIVFSVYDTYFSRDYGYTVVFKVTDAVGNYICYAYNYENDIKTDHNIANVYYIDSDGNDYSNSILPDIHLDSVTYAYHVSASLVVGPNTSFNEAVVSQPVGMIQWLSAYLDKTTTNGDSITKSFKNWNVNYGFRTNGISNADNLSLIVGNTKLDDTSYALLSYHEVSPINIPITGFNVQVTKIGRASLLANDKYAPLGTGDDWQFVITAQNKYDSYFSYYELDSATNPTTITLQNRDFFLHQTITSTKKAFNSLNVSGIQNLLTILYGIHLYYETNNFKGQEVSYYTLAIQLIETLYMNGCDTNDIYYINPFTREFTVDIDLGSISEINPKSASPFYMRSYLCDANGELLDSSRYSILRQHSHNYLAINNVAADAIAYGRLSVDMFDTIVLFRNNKDVTITNAFLGLFPGSVTINALRHKFTGRYAIGGYYINANGDIVNNIQNNIDQQKKTFNIYSPESPFKNCMYSLFGYRYDQIFVSSNISAVGEFRMMRDAYKLQGTNLALDTVYKNKILLGSTYERSDVYMLKIGEYGTGLTGKELISFDVDTNNSMITIEV